MSGATHFTKDMDVAVFLGRSAANAKNQGDKNSVSIVNDNLMELVGVVPEKFQQALLIAYTVAYVKHLEV